MGQCADGERGGGGGGKGKEMLAALRMVLYRSLSLSKQQLLEKSLESGGLVIDPSDIRP